MRKWLRIENFCGMKIAVFAGSFDPITLGHEDLVRRSAGMFDKLVVAIGANSEKKCCYDTETRMNWIKGVLGDLENVEVHCYEGLTADYCKQIGAGYLLRGVRNAMDLAYEQQIAEFNRRVAPEIETVLLMTRPELADISSTAVREMLRYGKSVKGMVPEGLATILESLPR